MLAAIKDYLKRIFRNTVASMTGGVSLILVVLDWSAPIRDQKHYFLVAGLLCLIVSTFVVWHAERKERLRLEREAGPNILLKVGMDTAGEYIQVINDGNETAVNCKFDDSLEKELKLLAVPWEIPFI